MEFSHKPVMVDRCIELLDIKPNGIYVDCTLGGGGHSARIVEKLTTGKLIAIDKDNDALSYCKEKFSSDIKSGKVILAHNDFKRFDEVLNSLEIDSVDGFMIDLGVSSWQLDNKERGFSYMSDNCPLDMRMDQTQSLTAETIVNTYSLQQLFELIRNFGEDNFAQNIAKNIVREREISPIVTTGRLADIIDKSIPYAVKKTGGHPAKRTFQALRIEVNKELDDLDGVLTRMTNRLNTSGRIVVLTFHSLEDRIVKHSFVTLSTGCICPPSYPICICGHKAKIKLITRKPITATDDELTDNPRSASAKLRVAERI
ncbi:MAG: 16S rRNA (cytosine(1402)-N(4))-methyltransferase RsmH [Clostridia bacterium]